MNFTSFDAGVPSPSNQIMPTQAYTAAALDAGRLADVRNYCECDVLNTYLVYQRFRLMRGELSAGEYAKEIALARERTAASNAPHWQQFMAAWSA